MKLFRAVGGGNAHDFAPRPLAGLDARQRVFKDNTIRGRIAQGCGGLYIDLGVRLAFAHKAVVEYGGKEPLGMGPGK